LNQVMATVVSNGEVMPHVYLMWLDCPGISQEARLGQFVMVRCGEETILRRPLSIHRTDGERLALLYAVVGKGTRWLATRQHGERIDILGPLGNGFTLDADSRNLLLVAGGMGIAPICYLAERAAKDGKQVTLLYGTANDDRYPVPTGIAEVAATEDGSVGHRGMITELIPQHLEGADQVFACGPLPMYRDMAVMPELKNRPVQVSLEMRMGCGFGVCYSCTIKTAHGLKQVCKDGPVFELNDVIWEDIRI
jgi:dihydroorotate dehydrogenase electron transfer subunit